jgi:hypothetical protein
MAQVGIVRLNNEYFREYAIEFGDTLVGICLRYGHRDWRAVYNYQSDRPDGGPNLSFRDRFPDPGQIDTVNAPHLFIPLPGAQEGGVSAHGAPIGDYFIARIADQAGQPLPDIPLQLITPEGARAGVRASADGDFVELNPAPGDWHLISPFYELVDALQGNQEIRVADVDSLPRLNSLPIATPHFRLTKNTINRIVGRRVCFIVCPMCAKTFKVVENPAGSNLCPNDGFNLTTIENEIENNRDSFISPTTGQNPKAPPAGGVKCRGTTSLLVDSGELYVYWDESRFVDPNGGNHTLWGMPASGPPKTVTVTGRVTWGAGPPDFTPLPSGEERVYQFHATPQGASKAAGADVEIYTSANPSNEHQPLGSGVLRWITIHHTTDDAQNGYATATALQQKHQIEGIEDQGPAADIGYHFIIDANGAIYEGRPLGIKGSHVGFWNGGHIGIVVAGDFEPRAANGFSPDTPTQAALNSLDTLVDVLAWRFNINSVWSHIKRKEHLKTEETECPGENLIPHVHDNIRPKYPDTP